jgi:pimeloyl-ACP methyl ester carboxylesterase
MERICRFGLNQGLSGILSEPEKKGLHRERPAVVLLNAGILHKVGPFRMNVELARILADRGFPVLRFDLGGLGDSAVRTGRGSETDRSCSDIESAFEFLQSTGVASSFVLIGLCSGADLALKVAGEDERVCGAVLLDGVAWATPRFHLSRQLARLGRWRSFLERKVKGMPEAPGRKPVEILERHFPQAAECRANVQSMVSRGVRLLLIYSGGYFDRYNYANQWKGMLSGLSLRGQVESEYFRYADHSYSFSVDRRLLVQRVGDWTERYFKTLSNPVQLPVVKNRSEPDRQPTLLRAKV